MRYPTGLLRYTGRTTFGVDFAYRRGSVFAQAAYNEIDGTQANNRSFRQRNGGSVTSFANGSQRNPNSANERVPLKYENFR